jgi:hypothetical protein
MDRASARDHTLVSYQEVRDRFLSRLDETDDVQWLVEVGSFVRDRWLAEENVLGPNEPLDEEKTWSLWDQCSEGHLRDLRAEAELEVQAYIKRRRVKAFISSVVEQTKPVHDILKILAWLMVQVFGGFVGAVGLLLFGILLSILFPGVVHQVRSTVTDVLPQAAVSNNLSE